MDDIILESAAIHRKAEKILEKYKLVEIWKSINAEVRFVGAFRADLMFDKDIDLHAYTKDLDAGKTLKAFAPLLADPRVLRCTYINGSETDEHCLEWHLALKDDESGEVWTLDMIQILAGSELDGVIEEAADAVKRALTPESHRKILELKKAAPAGNMICGIEFYRAVIEDHVQTWSEFVE